MRNSNKNVVVVRCTHILDAASDSVKAVHETSDGI